MYVYIYDVIYIDYIRSTFITSYQFRYNHILHPTDPLPSSVLISAPPRYRPCDCWSRSVASHRMMKTLAAASPDRPRWVDIRSCCEFWCKRSVIIGIIPKMEIKKPYVTHVICSKCSTHSGIIPTCFSFESGPSKICPMEIRSFQV